jgi:hypothetical protein
LNYAHPLTTGIFFAAMKAAAEQSNTAVVTEAVRSLLASGNSSSDLAESLRRADGEHVEEAIKELMCMPKLVAQVQSSDTDEQMKAFGVLEVLAACSAQVSWRVCGVIGNIISALGGDLELALAAVRCLGALSLHEEIPEHFVSQGIIAPLKRLLAVGSEQIIRHCLLLLSKIALDSVNSRIEMCEQKVVRSLTHTLLCQYYSAETKQLVIQAAFNTAQPRDFKQNKSASFATIVTHMALHGENACVQTEGVWCIHLLSEQAEDMQQKLTQIPCLVEALFKAVLSAPEDATRNIAQRTLDSLGIDSCAAIDAATIPTAASAAAAATAATAGQDGDDDDWLNGIVHDSSKVDVASNSDSKKTKNKKKTMKKKEKKRR